MRVVRDPSGLDATQRHLWTGLYPTPGGVFLLLTTLLLLLTAINYANNLIFAMAFFVLAAWGQAAWEAWRNLAGVNVGEVRTVSAHAGEIPVLHVRVDSRRAAQGLSLSWRRLNGPVNEVPARGQTRLVLPVPGLERGEHVLDDLRLTATDSLGLWRMSRSARKATVLIYPAVERGVALPGAWGEPAHRHMGGDALEGIRPYRPGDPLVRVNWKVAAKRDDLVVNQFDGGQGSAAVWLDLAGEVGGLEARLSRLAGQVLAAEEAGREWGMRLGEQCLEPDSGEAHRHACLTALARYRES